MADREDQRTARAREHLANERTLFAWIRTALAIMALGFVVARFGLFLRAIGGGSGGGTEGGEIIGLVLGAAGVLTTGLSLRRFLRAREQIEHGHFVPELLGDVLVVSLTLAVGVALVVYLLISRTP